MKKLLLSGVLGLSVIFAFATNPLKRTCGTMDVLQQQLANDPTLAGRMQQIENQTNAYIAAQKHSGNTAQAIVTVPVVFHVVYANSAQNISDAQCQYQLDQLNADYARLNSDAGNTPSVWQSVAANTQVQFCLAVRDPNGVATTGVVHKSTTTSSFSSNDKVKSASTGGDNAWDATKYLNIWSCNLGGGLLGYAQFPGGPAATDGVVFLYSSLGSIAHHGTAAPYDLGRTATHEIGHWLNLYHIWGDDGGSCSGTDNVGDTPNQGSENYGCPTFPHTDACSSGNGVMFMNYMDYTDDGCMNMFTAGQTSRMQALFATGGARVSILSSQGCVPVTGGTCNVPTGLSTTSISSSSATLNWGTVTGALSYNVQYRVVGAGSWTSTTSSTNSKAISGLTASTNYEWQVQTVCSGGSSAFTGSTTFTTSAVTSCGVAGGQSTAGITSSAATLNWTAVTGAVSYNVQYRVVGAGSWTSTTSSTNSKAISGLTASTNYEWQVQTVCSSTSSAFSGSATFTTSSAGGGCTDVYEPNNTRGTAPTVATNVHITGMISQSGDNDYFKFTTTSPNTNVKLDLTNLPADYDLKLYSSSGSVLATSQNSGTTAEQIKRNTSTAATYYAKVYGYSGANSSTVCYDLLISVGSTAWRESADVITEPVAAMNEMVVYPNPSTGAVTIGFTSATEGTATIRVVDIVGKEITSQKVIVANGNNKYAFDLSSTSKGIYFVQLTNDGENLVQRLILDK